MQSVATVLPDAPRSDPRDPAPTYLLEPEVILPAQYYDPGNRLSAIEGERRLMLAILEDAIYCFMKYVRSRSGSGRKLHNEASRWIMQPQPHWLYSFESICSTLAIDEEGLRSRLDSWRREQLVQPAETAVHVPRTRWRVGRARRVRPPRVRNRRPRGIRQTDEPLAAIA